MGHFSHCCKLSGLPIIGGTPVVLIVMKPVDNLYEYSHDNLKRYGSTYMCSNDTTRFKFSPVWFPIKGKYNDYGDIEDIVEDDNTKILESYYNLSIQEIISIVTSGRKSDGYDESLKIIKKDVQRPANQLEGEKHFDYYQRIMNDLMPFGNGRYPQSPNNKLQIWRDGKYVDATKEQYDADFKLIHEHYARYQEWSKLNPDVEDDYGKPEYLDRYKELLSYSGMWVHGELYDRLTAPAKNKIIDEYSHLGFGRPELLNALGFTEGEKTTDERYNRPFTKGKLTIMSDGNWLENGVYSLTDFKELLKSCGEKIDFSILDGKSKVEQIYDIVVPTVNLNNEDDVALEILHKNNSNDEFNKYYYNKYPQASEEDLLHYCMKLFTLSLKGSSREMTELYRYFLNDNDYRLSNPLTNLYLQAAKEGRLKDNLLRFWKFDNYMYACGRYYEIVGTSPQDGLHQTVLKVLTVAKDILEKFVEENKEDEIDIDE